jgi:hypothetical protein
MSEWLRPAHSARFVRKTLAELFLGACILGTAATTTAGRQSPSPPAGQTSLAGAGSGSAAPAPSPSPAPSDLAGLEKVLGLAALDPARAVAVQHLALSGGLARMELEHGVLIPAAAMGGRTLEMVFVGAGRVTLEPPDAIEAGQLDWFTGRASLDEEISAAVLVLGMDGAGAALLRRPAAAPAADQLATATDLFAAWKRRERRVMGVEGRILGRAAGDPALAGYFAALCRSARLGDFLYLFDPQSAEQGVLGHFVPIEPTAKEKKEDLKALAREQRKGHMVGVDLDELGTWDTWVSAAKRDSQGQPQPGAAAFEPRLYDLDTSLADKDLRLTGRARLELVPVLAGARTVKLRLQRDLAVSRVSLAAASGPAADLVFHRDGNGLTVVLPRAFDQGETVGLTVEYSGSMIDDLEGNGDQWMSEALASYCALHFAAHSQQGSAINGPEPSWQRSLSQTVGDGRSVESIGPVVLGVRLISSRSRGAYQAIVYGKGSVVLKTLEATVGTDRFLHALGEIARQNANRTLSTEELVSQLGKLTGTDLSPFAEQFIYGTGMPTIIYSYSFEPQAGGAYKVIGRTRQETPHQYRYRVVKTAAGAFDVQREAIAGRTADDDVRLAVPAEIEFIDPAPPPGKKGGASLTVLGRLFVHGASSDFAIDVKGEPKAFSLDRRGEVFARFYDEKRHPRRSQLVAAKIAADQDHVAEAEALLVKALAIDDKDEADPWLRATTVGGMDGFHRVVVEMDHKVTQRQLTAEIQLSRARLFLQQGCDAEAKAALDATGAGDAASAHLAAERDVLLSWLDVHRGLFDSAFSRLRDSHANTAEATLLLAIAARASGHRDEATAALKAARRKGADATLLQAATPAV